MRIVVVCVLAWAVLASSPANARIRIDAAEYHSGTVVIVGRAGRHQIVTLNRRLHKRANRRGRFVFRLNYAPRGCMVRLASGRHERRVTIDGCRTGRSVKARQRSGACRCAVRSAPAARRDAPKMRAPERPERSQSIPILPAERPRSPSEPGPSPREVQGIRGETGPAGPDRPARKGPRVHAVPRATAVNRGRPARRACKVSVAMPGQRANQGPRCRKCAA